MGVTSLSFFSFQDEEDDLSGSESERYVSDLEFPGSDEDGDERLLSPTAPFSPRRSQASPARFPGPFRPSQRRSSRSPPARSSPATSAGPSEFESNVMSALERLTARLEELDARTRPPFEGFTPPRGSHSDPHEGTAPSRPAPALPREAPSRDPPVSLHPCPAARKLPFSSIPPEWNVLEPGFVLGQQPHTIVLPDGKIWGAEMVEVDETTYVVPVWRMRKLHAPSRQASVIMPVREAYDALASFFSEAPTLAAEWSGETFHPPGSTSSRALEVNLSSACFLPAFFKQVPTWFQSLVARDGGNQVERKKALWEEATSPSNLVPGGIEDLVPAEYVAFFAGPELSRSQAALELSAKRLSKVPIHVPKEEHKARTVLLAQLNNAIGAEALSLRLGTDTPAGSSAKAVTKGILLSLWQAFHSYAIKKLAFRKRALRGCFAENVLYQRLVSSNPFSVGLFDPLTVRDITN